MTARDALGVDAYLARLAPDAPVDVDLFAGPGGWDVAASLLGLAPIGVEWDEHAVATARAAGHLRVLADVSKLDPRRLAGHRPVRLLIGSPSCVAFTVAGSGSGNTQAARAAILAAVSAIGSGVDARAAIEHVGAQVGDPRVSLVLEPLRWAVELEPETIALEQVPPVLPLWQAVAEVLRSRGYSVATGNLAAEQYDAPQTRRRAILVASRVREARLPSPTRQPYRKGLPQGAGDAALLPWLSMAEALGWQEDELVGFPRRPETARSDGRSVDGRVVTLNGTDYRARDLRPATDPAPALTGKARSWSRWALRSNYGTGGDPKLRGERRLDEPAATVTSKAGRNVWQHDGTPGQRVTLEEAAALQGFPQGYPWAGSRTVQYRQVGDAVPPPLAWHVLRAALGLPVALYRGQRPAAAEVPA